MDQKTRYYSTSSMEMLSLDNPNVQKYLNSLKNKYESALKIGDVSSMKFVQTVSPVMDILQEVSSSR